MIIEERHRHKITKLSELKFGTAFKFSNRDTNNKKKKVAVLDGYYMPVFVDEESYEPKDDDEPLILCVNLESGTAKEFFSTCDVEVVPAKMLVTLDVI